MGSVFLVVYACAFRGGYMGSSPAFADSGYVISCDLHTVDLCCGSIFPLTGMWIICVTGKALPLPGTWMSCVIEEKHSL